MPVMCVSISLLWARARADRVLGGATSGGKITNSRCMCVAWVLGAGTPRKSCQKNHKLDPPTSEEIAHTHTTRSTIPGPGGLGAGRWAARISKKATAGDSEKGGERGGVSGSACGGRRASSQLSFVFLSACQTDAHALNRNRALIRHRARDGLGRLWWGFLASPSSSSSSLSRWLASVPRLDSSALCLHTTHAIPLTLCPNTTPIASPSIHDSDNPPISAPNQVSGCARRSLGRLAS